MVRHPEYLCGDATAIETAVVEMAIDKPAFGRVRVSNEP